jgi:hypothetical protein
MKVIQVSFKIESVHFVSSNVLTKDQILKSQKQKTHLIPLPKKRNDVGGSKAKVFLFI